MSASLNYDMNRIGLDAIANEIPISVAIELLTECNWRCKHCYIPNHNNRGLSFEQLTKLIDELRDFGVFHILLTGGEVFLREDIVQIVEYIRRKHMRVNILSNSSLITDEVAKRLSEAYIADVSSTIFSLDPKIHDEITSVNGSLENALKGMKILYDNGISVEIKTPLLNSNFMEIEKVKAYAETNGYRFSSSPCIAPKSNGDSGPQELSLDMETLKDVIKKVDNLSNYKPLDFLPYYMCQTLKQSFFISSSGDLFPCNGLYIKMGNILESSVQEIWNKDEYKKLRNYKSTETKECVACDVSDYCERCPGIIFSEKQDLFGCSSTCKDIAVARNTIYNEEVK